MYKGNFNFFYYFYRIGNLFLIIKNEQAKPAAPLSRGSGQETQAPVQQLANTICVSHN
jgi:hypothetical protein